MFRSLLQGPKVHCEVYKQVYKKSLGLAMHYGRVGNQKLNLQTGFVNLIMNLRTWQRICELLGEKLSEIDCNPYLHFHLVFHT